MRPDYRLKIQSLTLTQSAIDPFRMWLEIYLKDTSNAKVLMEACEQVLLNRIATGSDLEFNMPPDMSKTGVIQTYIFLPEDIVITQATLSAAKPYLKMNPDKFN